MYRWKETEAKLGLQARWEKSNSNSNSSKIFMRTFKMKRYYLLFLFWLISPFFMKILIAQSLTFIYSAKLTEYGERIKWDYNLYFSFDLLQIYKLNIRSLAFSGLAILISFNACLPGIFMSPQSSLCPQNSTILSVLPLEPLISFHYAINITYCAQIQLLIFFHLL